MTSAKRPLSYADSGVDIDTGDSLIDEIKPMAEATYNEGVATGIGGFGALFEIPDRFRNPVLVSGTDGVGTKLKLATTLDMHDTIGVDLVAMCVNDVLSQGAEPLFFLDYFATGRLRKELAKRVIRGIAVGCRQAGAALIGGETAEMPGMYRDEDYDLAGFCVGAVERDAIIDGRHVDTGDTVIGIASSGPHSNGYSLIRHIIDLQGVDLSAEFEDITLGEALLIPTRIYVKPVLDLISKVPVRALAHITGGGLPGNIARVLPAKIGARLERSAWKRPLIFDWIQERGEVAEQEMLRTFNCGIGMVAVVPASEYRRALNVLTDHGLDAWAIGSTVPRGDLTVEI